METPITKQNSNSQSVKESLISREARNAFLAAIIFMVAVFANVIISLRSSFLTRTIASFGDSITVLILFILIVFSARMIWQGQKEKGVWFLLYSLIFAMTFRNLFTAGLGLIFAIIAFSLIPIIGLLTLKSKVFGRVLSLGFISGIFFYVFDLVATRYFPANRQLLENNETMMKTIILVAILILVIFAVFVLAQHRFLLLSSKIILAMVVVVLIPIIILAITGSNSLRNSLGSRQNEILQTKATFVAQSINRFIQTNKNVLRADGETPVLIEYLSYLESPQPEEALNLQNLEEQALENLRSFQRRNTLQINSYAILDLSGKIILDTSTENIGKNEAEADYFTQALTTGAPFVSDIVRSDSNEHFLYFSAPIHKLVVDEKTGVVDKTVGIIRAEYDFSAIRRYIIDYMNTEGANKPNIYSALLSEKQVPKNAPEDPTSVYLVLANSKNLDLNLKSVTPLTTNIITPLQMNHILPVGSTAQLSLDVPGLDQGLRRRSISPVFEAQAFPRVSESSTPLDVIAAVEIEESLLPWILIVSQDIKSINAPIQRQNDISTLIAFITAIGAAILAYFGSQYLTRPVLRLAETADIVAKGDFSARAIINTEDEIGALGKSFNIMTDQLNSLITTLEDRVAERTKDLERRAEQLRAATAVGHAAASLRDLDKLLSQAAVLISQQFGFYHAAIFLIDIHGNYAVLKAANSLGGLRMLARTHKLKVGEEGIVGYVTASGEPRIALDVGQDAVFFNNPDLPQTRSEMALPLIAGGKILGALDIQSKEKEAFGEADIDTLQVLADQIAISIENARLFEESRIALSNVRRAYGEQSHLGWQELVHQGRNFGYRSASDGSIFPLEEKLGEELNGDQPVLDENNLTANIPIKVRGKSVGTIRLSKPDNTRSWDQKDLELAETLTNELSQAMDSARLFDETRQQADRERIVGEIASRMQETMNVESVVRLAADELYNLLDLDHVTIHLLPDDEEEKEEII